MASMVLSWQRILSGALVLALVEGVTFAAPLQAQSGLAARVRALFGRQERIGVARGRSGAAIRDPDLCPTVAQPLTALVPDISEPVRTRAAHPTFWFYVPYTLTARAPEQVALKFVLQDESHHTIYQTSFTLPETTSPGIVSLRFPSQAAALETGRTYRWYFLIYCDDPQQIYEPAFVEGRIQRQTLALDRESAIAQAALSERFLLYVEERLWSDALTALVEARQADPDSPMLREAWESVLQGVDLGAISQQPIVGHYYVPLEEQGSNHSLNIE